MVLSWSQLELALFDMGEGFWHGLTDPLPTTRLLLLKTNTRDVRANIWPETNSEELIFYFLKFVLMQHHDHIILVRSNMNIFVRLKSVSSWGLYTYFVSMFSLKLRVGGFVLLGLFFKVFFPFLLYSYVTKNCNILSPWPPELL